jgi:hypothetical protein
MSQSLALEQNKSTSYDPSGISPMMLSICLRCEIFIKVLIDKDLIVCN